MAGKEGEGRGERYNGHERKAENRTYRCNKGLVYESVSQVCQAQSGTTRRHGIRQGQKKELAKINYVVV